MLENPDWNSTPAHSLGLMAGCDTCSLYYIEQVGGGFVFVDPHHSEIERAGVGAGIHEVQLVRSTMYTTTVAMVEEGHIGSPHNPNNRYPPPPLCNSHTKVPNQYGPYTYRSLDKAVACPYTYQGWI